MKCFKLDILPPLLFFVIEVITLHLQSNLMFRFGYGQLENDLHSERPEERKSIY